MTWNKSHWKAFTFGVLTGVIALFVIAAMFTQASFMP